MGATNRFLAVLIPVGGGAKVSSVEVCFSAKSVQFYDPDSFHFAYIIN